MTYLLDGYNLLHAIGLLAGRAPPGGLEKARNSLIDLARAAHEPGAVTIVFDARKAAAARDGEEVKAGVRIVYTHSEEADDLIERLIAREPTPRNLVVVSNDHRLRVAAERRRCGAWSCEHYLDWIERAPTRPPSATLPEKPTSGDAREWLDAFGSLDDDPMMRELFGDDFTTDGDWHGR